MDGHLRRTLIVVGVGAFLSVLEMTVVNVSLDTLGQQLHGSITSVQWIVTAYLLALAGSVPLTGWLSRRMGPRNLYVWALVVFTVASALCAVAWSVGALVAFRVLQGIGGGALLPVAQVLAVRAAGPAQMRKAVAVIYSIAVTAPVIGPVIGGVIVDQASWRWIFLINVPIGIVGAALALRLLPADEREDAGSVDWVGLVTLGTGLPLMTYSLTELGQGAGLASIQGLPTMAVGIGLIAYFVAHARRAAHPLLELRLYADRVFATSAATMTMLGATIFGTYLLMPLFFQDVRGSSPIEAGLLFGSQGLGASVAGAIGDRIQRRLSLPQTAVAGTVVAGLCTVPLAIFDQSTPTALFVIFLVLRGFGIGMVAAPVFAGALTGLSSDHMADATAQLNVIMRVGGAAATAVIAVLLAHELHVHGGGAAATADAYQATWRFALIIHALAVIPTLLLLRASRRAQRVEAHASVAAGRG